MKNLLIILFLISFAVTFSCKQKPVVDVLVHNAHVYTVDSAFTITEALAVKDGSIVAVGKSADLLNTYTASKVIDAKGAFLYPGLIDAHSHFMGYGLSLQRVNLMGTNSFAEVIQKVQAHRKSFPDQAWITGRGWDQNDWTVKQFPTKDTLDLLYPNTPVLLKRVDGHAALANQKALDLAKITPQTKAEGGFVELRNGKLTGLLVDNAVSLVEKVIPKPSTKELIAAFRNAEKNCFAVGLTSVADAGLDGEIVQLIDSLHKAGALQMRVYAMLNPSPDNFSKYLASGPLKTERLTAASFKIYADGALGSRGACLLHEYADLPGHKGFLVTTEAELTKTVRKIAASNFQMNTHCIGDSANRLLLNLYAQVLKPGNNRRWRIEHAQVVAPADLPAFRKYGIIPSVQPTHATSDMYWAAERLGPERVKTAYAYHDLWQQNNMVAFGSDFPVEDINPIFGFHAAIARQDAKNFPAEGFQKENALSRKQALLASTYFAAYANFEEKQKGSLEPGKVADFILIDTDLMHAPLTKLRAAKVQQTWLNGKRVY